MLILTNATLWNPGVLETRSLPKKFLGRVLVLPRAASLRDWARLLVEVQLLRYGVTLLPFAMAPVMQRDLAITVMQAPALMVLLVAVVELKVLRLTKPGRAALVGPDDAARRLDTLAFRARDCLRRIAARHDLRDGELRLVVEQSPLARIAPLTLVTVQGDRPGPHVLALDAEDRALIGRTLFDHALTERDLLAVNHRDDLYIRDIAQEARAVSAHARLAALLEKGGTAR